MPVTPEQGRMIATLAVACRPIGAPRWDEAGTLAAIKRVSTWNLAVVIENAIKHASDPRAVTPGVIGGSYTPPDLVLPTPTPPRPGEGCKLCGGWCAGPCVRDQDAPKTTPAECLPPLEEINPTLAARLKKIGGAS